MDKIVSKICIFIMFFILIFLNQNCGEFSGFDSTNLASIHDNSILDVEQPSSKARVGDRIFIATVFADVFLPMGDDLSTEEVLSKAGEESLHLKRFITSSFLKEDKEISDLIIQKVLKRAHDFRGSCSFISKDPTCSSRVNLNGRKLDAEIGMISSASAIREGYRISVCNEVIALDRSIQNISYNLTGVSDSSFKEDYIERVYDLFYPEQSLNQEAYDDLKAIFEDSKSEGESELDIWRAVVIPLCYSSGWQIP